MNLRLWLSKHPRLTRIWSDESGQDIIEYALILALIAMLAVTGFPPLATAIQKVFTGAQTCLNAPTTCGATTGGAATGGTN